MDTANLSSSLKSLKVTDSLHKDDNLVDITKEFFDLTSTIKFSTIVKSNNFSLLQGTHALELLNPRLDTFLLDVVDYDINTKLSSNDLVSIISNQLKSLVCWLGENISITTSILSSDYICKILNHYTKFGNLNQLFDNIVDNDEIILIVLKFSILIISNVKFILSLSLKSQIYQDEDLSTLTMNLNWLLDLSNNEIFKLTLVTNKTWDNLKSKFIEEGTDLKFFDFIKDSFQILQTITSLDSVIQWKSPLFNQSKDFDMKLNNKLKQLHNIVEKLSYIELLDSEIDVLNPPKNSFNENSQILFDNQSPPKKLQIFDLGWADCVVNFNQLFDDLIDILKIFKSNSLIETIEWLEYLENKRHNNSINEINGLHIIARVLLYSVIFNDTNINNNEELTYLFNSPNLKFKSFFWNFLKEFSLKNSKIDLEINSKKPNHYFLQQVDYYLETISFFWKELLYLPTLNPSRQRQFKCKELKYWNSRQIESGQLEDCFIENGFYKSNEKFYPLTFMIIYFKLKTTINLILKSIELHLYKDVRELVSVYYQLTLITYQFNQHIDILIIMNSNNKNFSSIKYLNFIKNENNLIYYLSILKSKQFEILAYLGNYKLPKKLIISNEELLYKLQWKQLNCLDDPKMLSFEDFTNKLNESLDYIKNCKFEIFEKEINSDIKSIIKEFNRSVTECKSIISNGLNWMEDLRNIKALNFENLQNEILKTETDFNKLIDLVKKEHLQENNNDVGNSKNIEVQIKYVGRHDYFPGIKIIENKNSNAK